MSSRGEKRTMAPWMEQSKTSELDRSDPLYAQNRATPTGAASEMQPAETP